MNELTLTMVLMLAFGGIGVGCAVWNGRYPHRLKASLAYVFISAALMTPIWMYRALEQVGGTGTDNKATYLLTYLLFLVISRFAVDWLTEIGRRGAVAR